MDETRGYFLRLELSVVSVKECLVLRSFCCECIRMAYERLSCFLPLFKLFKILLLRQKLPDKPKIGDGLRLQIDHFYSP